jgi:multidrug efflux pump subunit AcrA (membrane-fusion protein)
VEADYARLKDLEAYKTIRAPLTGPITARNTDIGQLITPMTGALVAQRQLQSLNTRQVQASVGLVVALGGGWQATPR